MPLEHLIAFEQPPDNALMVSKDSNYLSSCNEPVQWCITINVEFIPASYWFIGKHSIWWVHVCACKIVAVDKVKNKTSWTSFMLWDLTSLIQRSQSCPELFDFFSWTLPHLLALCYVAIRTLASSYPRFFLWLQLPYIWLSPYLTKNGTPSIPVTSAFALELIMPCFHL